MSSRTLLPISGPLVLGLAALLLAAPASAAKVYQWKDANGVTHYSDAPPPGQQGVQNRQVSGAAPASASSEAKPDEDPNCVTARSNLTRLKGDQSVGLDADGDGKADKAMSAEERAQQVKQTEEMLKTWCDKPAAST